MNAYNLEGIFPHPFSNEILTLDVNKIADLCYGLKDSAGVEIKKVIVAVGKVITLIPI